MSMNLQATVISGHTTAHIELWQTPTQISYTILPKAIKEVTGKKAKEALERYIEWVNYSATGIYTDPEELAYNLQEINKHIRYITNFLHNPTLRLWVM